MHKFCMKARRIHLCTRIPWLGTTTWLLTPTSTTNMVCGSLTLSVFVRHRPQDASSLHLVQLWRLCCLIRSYCGGVLHKAGWPPSFRSGRVPSCADARTIVPPCTPPSIMSQFSQPIKPMKESSAHCWCDVSRNGQQRLLLDNAASAKVQKYREYYVARFDMAFLSDILSTSASMENFCTSSTLSSTARQSISSSPLGKSHPQTLSPSTVPNISYTIGQL